MLVIAGLVLGAVWGSVSAKRRGGTGFDIAQYAGVFAIIGAILGLVATLLIDRLA